MGKDPDSTAPGVHGVVVVVGGGARIWKSKEETLYHTYSGCLKTLKNV